MARTLSRNSRLYDSGSYGPFSIDSFTNANSEYLLLTLTNESWPNVSGLLDIRLTWNTGEGARFIIPGSSISPVVLQVPIPKLLSEKRQVSSATAIIVVLQTLRTAFTFQAV